MTLGAVISVLYHFDAVTASGLPAALSDCLRNLILLYVSQIGE